MRTLVIPIAGNSRRFFDAGYSSVKYKLPAFKKKSILWNILSYINRDQKLIIILNKKYNDKKWLEKTLFDLKFSYHEIIEIADTDGQLTSVLIGLKGSTIVDDNDELLIYNGDTIRHIPFDVDFKGISGVIEVFKKEGEHWSFTDNLGRVKIVREKERISDYCSTGLYGFSSVSLFFEYAVKSEKFRGEKFIAPIYNKLIEDGFKVYSFLSDADSFTLCGTPSEYELNFREISAQQKKIKF
jgi:hypothetical protein